MWQRCGRRGAGTNRTRSRRPCSPRSAVPTASPFTCAKTAGTFRDRDVFRLRETVITRLNLEMAASDEMIAIALTVKPDEATLVPEKRQELTTEGGLDVVANAVSVGNAVAQLKAAGVHVSLFIDPEPAQIEASHKLKADAIEFQTASLFRGAR